MEELKTHRPGESPEEFERAKRALYDGMNPRRRKFVDRIGYENWEPFAAPKDPIEIRKDPTNRTIQQLASEFLRAREDHESYTTAYAEGALEMAHALMRGEDRYQGMYGFSVWYDALRRRESQPD